MPNTILCSCGCKQQVSLRTASWHFRKHAATFLESSQVKPYATTGSKQYHSNTPPSHYQEGDATVSNPNINSSPNLQPPNHDTNDDLQLHEPPVRFSDLFSDFSFSGSRAEEEPKPPWDGDESESNSDGWGSTNGNALQDKDEEQFPLYQDGPLHTKEEDPFEELWEAQVLGAC